MAHLNIYVPDDLAANLKKEAKAAGVPLSRFLVERLPGGTSGEHWPADFFERSCGFLTEEMDEPADPLPEPTEALELS